MNYRQQDRIIMAIIYTILILMTTYGAALTYKGLSAPYHSLPTTHDYD